MGGIAAQVLSNGSASTCLLSSPTRQRDAPLLLDRGDRRLFARCRLGCSAAGLATRAHLEGSSAVWYSVY